MRLKSIGFSFAVVTAMCLTAAPAMAQGRGHGKDKDKDNDHHGATVDRHDDVPPGLAKKGGVPPGLAKKGGLPPGQAKRHYEPDDGVNSLRNALSQHGYTVVRTRSDGTSRDVYYRYHNGSLRRAVVSPGTDELGFSNVPSSVLRDLRSMLHY